ncbi:MAG: hypothetical protein GEU79_16110 [Acidimicrobiia bacterium]|nr:hypothetical protein [Acidimicrobiia bacterium]
MVFLLSIAAFAAYSTGSSEEVVVSNAGLRAGRIAGFDHAREAPPPSTAVTSTTINEPKAAVVQTSDSTLEPKAVRGLMEKYFLPPDVSRAVRVAWCSSHFEVDRVSADGRIGLFQHTEGEWATRAEGAGVSHASPVSPDPNTAAAAWEVYEGVGWSALVCPG